MGSNADGSIHIDTELDNSGFDKGSDKLLGALKSLENSVNAIGDTLSSGFDSVIKSLQVLSSQAVNADQQITSSAQQAATAYQDVTQAAQAASQATQNMAGTAPQKLSTEYNNINRAAVSLHDQITRLSTAAETGFKNDGQILRYRDNVDIVTRKVEELRNRLNALGATQIPTEGYQFLQSEVDKTDKALQRLLDRQKRLDATGAKTNSQSYKRLQYDIDNARKALDMMHAEMADMEANGEAFTLGINTAEYQNMSNVLGTLEGELAGVQDASANAMLNLSELAATHPILGAVAVAARKAGNALLTVGKAVAGAALHTFVNAVKKLGSGLKTVASNAKKAVTGLFSFNKAAKSGVNPVNTLLRGLTSFKTLILSRIKQNFISQITKQVTEGIQQFARYSSEFNQAMSNMKNTGSQIAGNIVSLMANIITYVEPVITRILSLVNSLVTVINALFAKLTGKSTIAVASKQTGSYADSLDDAAGSASKAAKEQKKFNAELYGWDELTRQNKQEDASDSDASGGGMTWTEVPVDDILKDWDSIDWFQLGYDWAEKIANALDSIPWDRIQAAAYKLGQNLALLLNGVFANLHLANSLGNTIAQALNTALSFALGFLETFDFSQFGVWAGTLWNAFVNAFAFDKLARVISLGGNGIIDALTLFFQTIAATCTTLGGGIAKAFNAVFVDIDFSALSNAILLGIHDFDIALKGFNDLVDWEGAAQNIINGMNVLIRGMAFNENGELINVWAENGTEIGRLIGGFMSSLGNIIAGLDYHSLGANIALFFSNMFSEIDFPKIIDDLCQAFNGIVDGLSTFISGVNWSGARDALINGLNTILQNIDSQFNANSWSNAVISLVGGLAETIGMVDWGTVTNILGEAIGGIISGLGTLISNADWGSAGISLGECLNNLVKQINWPKLGSDIANGFNGVITFLDEAIKSFDWFSICYGIGNMLSEAITGIDWGSIGTLLSDGLGAIIDGLVGFIMGIDWMSVGYSLFEGLGSMIANIDWIGLIGKLGSLLISMLVGAIELLIGAIGGIVVGLVEALYGVGKNIIEGLFNGIIDVISGIGSWLKEHIVDPIVDGVKSLFGIASPSTVFSEIGGFLVSGLLQGLQGAWESISGFFSTSLENIKTTISSAWENVKSNTTAAWSTVKSGLSEAWTNIKSTVTTAASNVKTTVTTAWDNLKSNTSTAYSNIKSTIQTNFNTAKTAVSSAITTMKSNAITGWQNMVSNAKTQFQNIYSTAKSKMSSVTSYLKGIQWGSIGTNLVNGLLSGLKSAWDSVTSWVSGAASSLTAKVKGIFGIASPSKVWAEIGTFLDAGLVEGLESGKRAMLSTASGLAESLTDRMGQADGTIEMTSDIDIARMDTTIMKLSRIADIINNISQALASMGGLQIPQIATGTFVPYKARVSASNQNEGYTNGVAVSDEMLQIMRNILEYLRQSSGNGGSDVKVIIDGREILNTVVNENNRAIRRTGASPIKV